MMSVGQELKKFEQQLSNQSYKAKMTKKNENTNTEDQIIAEFNKMRQIFINYCKLNEKLYQNILQHEADFHQQSNKITSISQYLQKKIEDNFNEIQLNYQSAVKYGQSKLKTQIIHQIIQPMNLQIIKRPSKQEIKQIVQQQYVVNITNQINNPQHPIHILTNKKQSRYQTIDQQLSTFKFDISTQLQRVQESFFKSLSKQHNDVTNLVSQIKIISQKNAQDNNQLKQKIQKVNKHFNYSLVIQQEQRIKQKNELLIKIQQIKLSFAQSIKNVDQTIKLYSQTYFQKPFEQYKVFQQKKITQLSEKNNIYFQKSINHQLSHSKQQQQNKFMFASIKQQIYKIKNFQNQIAQTTNKNYKQHQQMILNSNKMLNQVNIKMEDSFSDMRQKIQTEIQYINDKFAYNLQQLDFNITKKLNRQLSNHNISINQKHNQIKQIQRSLFQKIQVVQNSYDGIKNIISQKANFTDLLTLSEKKADKQQIEFLKQSMAIDSFDPSRLRINTEQINLSNNCNITLNNSTNIKRKKISSDCKDYEKDNLRQVIYTKTITQDFDNATKKKRSISILKKKRYSMNAKTTDNFNIK